ncbi:hypothetical protein [Paraburkholderia guartelaensis]|uniref:hypothetical protein n=1 Tax=Paraburkholderia guartelaensis TaxID=2546446 RepID=UPI002AB6D870|nr:hypothetical protein [Paraburkholderia guartelaensis]
MSEFLTRLIARNTRAADVIRPHVPSLFEPQPDAMTTASAARGDMSDDWLPSMAGLDTDAPDAAPAGRPRHGEPAKLGTAARQTIAGAGNPSMTDDAGAHVIELRVSDAASHPRAPVPRRERASSLHTDRIDDTQGAALHGQRARQPPDTGVAPEPSARPPAARGSDRSHVAPVHEESDKSDREPLRMPAPRSPVAAASVRALTREAGRDPGGEGPGLLRPAPLRPEVVAQGTPRHVELGAPLSVATREFSGRKRDVAQDAARDREPEPTVHVTIGRIEIRAEQAPARSAPKPRDGPQAATLTDYLRACAARRRG